MLRVMAQYKRSQNAILLGMVGILAVGMIIAYGTPARWWAKGSTGVKVAEPVSDTEVVAEVDGRIITAKDYSDGILRFLAIYKNFASQSPSADIPKSVRDLRQRGTDKELLRSLLREKLIEVEAERLRLTVTDDELRQRIREQNSPDGKWIGYEKFKRGLERQGTNIIEYERNLRQSILEEKLKSYVASGVQISPREVEKDYKESNTKFDIAYVMIDDTSFTDKVTPPTDAEVRAYFDSHKDDFRATKDQRKIRYIYINQEKAGNTIPVTDEELHKEYNPDTQIKSIHVKQIVLKVLTPKDEDTVQKKANELAARARGTENKPGEDFDTLARGNSQDTASAPKGGDLGVIERSAVKSGDPLESAFTLGVNQVSAPIRSQSGDAYYIFKVTEKTIKTFEEAKAGLMATVRNRLSYKKASEFSDKAQSLLAQNHDVQKTAAEIAKDMSTKDSAVSPQDLIRETPYFVPGDELPEIGSNPSFEEATSVLTKKGDVGVKTGVRGGFAIPQLAEDIRKPGEPVFEEVKTKVAEKAKQGKMIQMAYDQAKELIAAAKNADGLKAAAENMKLKFADSKDFSSFGNIGGKTFPGAFYNLDKIKVGELLPTPLYSALDAKSVSVGVVAVTKRTDADLTKLPEQTKSIEERLRSTRTQNLFDAYMDGCKARMKEAGRLKVYSDVVERVLIGLTANEAAAAEPGQ